MKNSERISIAVISQRVGKTPEDIIYSFIFDEIYRLTRKGINVYVIRATREKSSLSYGIHFYGLEKKNVFRVFKLSLKNMSKYPIPSFLRKPTTLYRENLYALNVADVVKKNDIDLIHAHFAYPEGIVGLLANEEISTHKKPLVITVHGYDILSEPSVEYGLRLSKRLEPLIRKVLNSADAIIAASKATYNETKKMVNNIDKVHLIPNGVDIQRFNPNLDKFAIKRKLGIEGCTVIFTLRHHEPKYGLEYLIKAAPIVMRRKKDMNIVFVIGGDGSLRHYHEQLAAKLGLKGKIIFPGRIPQNEVPYYYAMSDIIVVPSLQEAFGLIVTEAMACGKPVIGTKVGGILDQIIDGYNGLLVQPRSPEEIAEKILYLIENPEEAKRMGDFGRKIVEEKFDINKRIDKIIALYEELIR